MTRFTGGPALLRAPLFLRVVQDQRGELDALDQLADAPEPDEAVSVYRRVKKDGRYFLDWADKRGRRRGVCFALCTYAYVEPHARPTSGASGPRPNLLEE